MGAAGGASGVHELGDAGAARVDADPRFAGHHVVHGSLAEQPGDALLDGCDLSAGNGRGQWLREGVAGA